MRTLFLDGLESHEGQMITRLLDLPHKILSHHDTDGIEQLILYELAQEQSFGFDKASYLIDNPDFDCLKGVAGYDRSQCRLSVTNPWENPRASVLDLKNAQFNQQVLTLSQNSLCSRTPAVDSDSIKELSGALGMRNPSFVTWKMKHGNHGILLFEEGDKPHARRDLLQHFVALLGLC